MKAIRAIVPAAGKGSRLQKINSELSKAMFPVRNRPMLEYVLENLSFIENKDIHQPALETRQAGGSIPAAQFAGLRIEGHISERTDIGSEFLPAAQHGPHPGEQLAHHKGLGQVIISACIQTVNPVINLCLGGQQKHRHGIAFLAQLG